MRKRYRVGNRATKAYTRRLIQAAPYIWKRREAERRRQGKKRNNTQNGSTIAACRLFMKHSPMYMPFYKYRVVYTERRQAIAIFSLLLIYTHIFSFYIVLNDEFFCLPASTWMETFGTAACAPLLPHSIPLISAQRALGAVYSELYYYFLVFLAFACELAYSIPKSV